MKRKIFNPGILILVLITGTILSSCKKDAGTTDNLVGTWTVNNPSITAMVGNVELSQYLANVLYLPPAAITPITQSFYQTFQKSFSGTITIKSDNTYTSTLGGTTDTGTWSLSADGKKLNISSSTKSPMEFDILSLTMNNLELRTMVTYSDDINSDGNPEIIDITVDANLTK